MEVLPFNLMIFFVLSIRVCLLMVSLGAGPRDTEWKKGAAAMSKDQPKTQIELLIEIEKAALAEGKWAEASRAMVQRIATEG